MKIYTRRGDSGQTDLMGGRRVPKDDARVCAYGTADELNAVLGICVVRTAREDARAVLIAIQGQLFDLGAFLATPDAATREKIGVQGVSAANIAAMEGQIDSFEIELPALRSFILPGGSEAAAALHHARAVCRRLERELVGLQALEGVDEQVLRFVNRLSDLLFVLARAENAEAGVAEQPWPAKEG